MFDSKQQRQENFAISILETLAVMSTSIQYVCVFLGKFVIYRSPEKKRESISLLYYRTSLLHATNKYHAASNMNRLTVMADTSDWRQKGA
ncbi:hypothetical protein BaRGS_00008825 [Batillaria attramentaria]|uniref:Uncharacterized protein n=1 Tax=Batillaria attramentaria TaxID=370345 RepID=A0ABD0LLX3_9CAEN